MVAQSVRAGLKLHDKTRGLKDRHKKIVIKFYAVLAELTIGAQHFSQASRPGLPYDAPSELSATSQLRSLNLALQFIHR